MRRAPFTSQREGRAQQVGTQPRRAAGKRHDEVRQPFGEDPPPTPADAAAEAADVQMEDNPVSRAREVGECARVVRMLVPGAALTERTARPTPCRGNAQMQGGPLTPEALEPHSGAMRKEQVGEHRGSCLSPGIISPGASAYRALHVIEPA